MFPIYGGSPGAAAVRYVDRVGNLRGIQVVIIAVGGPPGGSLNTMKQNVQTANGVVMEALAPNEGNGNSTDIARQAGSRIAP